MKKVKLLMVAFLFVIALTGCKKDSVSIKSSNIDVNTMLVKSDGTVQVATIEEFGQSYYDLTELKEFVNESINAYNTKMGEESAVVLDSLDERDGYAVMILNYADMMYYADFNESNAKHAVGITDDEQYIIPDTLTSVEDGSTIDTKTLYDAEDDFHMVILDEEYDLIVSSNIKYYAGGTLVDDKTIQTGINGTTVVIY